jgi:release factor glutamine methyltransferase
MDSIRRIVDEAPRALAPGGWLLMEHHHDQSERVLKLLAARGMVDGQFHRDLEGHRRFVVARRPSVCVVSAAQCP